MYKEIIPLLQCPVCNNGLNLKHSIVKNDEIIQGDLQCKCKELWEIQDGVLNFRVEEQESVNQWSELTEDMTFEELEKMILEKTPDNQKELSQKAIEDIIFFINAGDPQVVIDIATGRGTLLTKLVKGLQKEIHLICIDLSFVVLKADRLKIQEINPNIKISFISCDCINLPIKDTSLDLAISFMGISNMRSSIPSALNEVNRILKPNHQFLNSSLIIKETSKGFNALKDYYRKNNIYEIEKFFLLDYLKDFHTNAGFTEVEFKKIGESLGQKNELDFLPFEGDWFSIGNIYARK